MRDTEAMLRQDQSRQRAAGERSTQTDEQGPAQGRPLTKEERAFVRTAPTPEERARVRAFAQQAEFRYSDIAELTGGMVPWVASWARAEIERTSYVPPNTKELLEAGTPASAILCGRGRALTPGLGRNPDVMKTKDLDAARAGITKLAEASAKATAALMSFGLGGGAAALAELEGAVTAVGAVKAALPLVDGALDILATMDPSLADKVAKVKILTSVASLALGGLDLATTSSGTAHDVVHALKLTGDAVDISLAAIPAFTPGLAPELLRDIRLMRSELGLLRGALGGAADGLGVDAAPR